MAGTYGNKKKQMINEYETQDKLNPEIWDTDIIHPDLRLRLLKIANYFYKYLKIDTPILDIILTGSNANYNWIETSDIDLHVIINFSEINKDTELVRKYLMAKKNLWNTSYPIIYKNSTIELYAQDVNEVHKASGQYSLLYDKWLVNPSYEHISIDDAVIATKADVYKDQIDKLTINDPMLIVKIKDLKEKLKKMRQAGLDKVGEYSIENLAFKSLRNSGHLAKIKDLENQLVLNLIER